jgi:tryptophan synthase alpha subunit
VDGVILVDLPAEEDPDVWDHMRGAGIGTIAMVAPTTRPSVCRPSPHEPADFTSWRALA